LLKIVSNSLILHLVNIQSILLYSLCKRINRNTNLMSNTILEVEGLSKRYRLGNGSGRISTDIENWWRKTFLRNSDISVELAEGRFFWSEFFC
jgi:hypothetical protein